ncbi:MAG: hypothetical protein ACFCVE_00920 [Phycisphaerae bacterium]
MNRLLEIILGLERGFLSEQGSFRFEFNPQWPWAQAVGNATWNVLLVAAVVALVVYVYRRDGRNRRARFVLAGIRIALLVFVIALLNRPTLTLVQSRTEPSVLAVMVDQSLSMRVPDAAAGDEPPISRVAAAGELLRTEGLLTDLAREHQLRFYTFDADAVPLAELAVPQGQVAQPGDLLARLEDLAANGQSTDLARSVATVLQDLQGQRLAGVVILSDGRSTPAKPISQVLARLEGFGVPLFPVAVGSSEAPRNLEVRRVSAEEAVFVGDLVNVEAEVRATGFPGPAEAVVSLVDAATGDPVLGPDGQPVRRRIEIDAADPQPLNLTFKADTEGTLELAVVVESEIAEVNPDDNRRSLQMDVLDAQIVVLYVDGYPRWDYRYLRNQLMRDPTVEVSLLLTSADPSFRQEGDRPITRFPVNMDELLAYDVVLFGDVDPRQFTDRQLQLVNEFVSTKGGGFGMVAGPRWSPQSFRKTAVEPVLPVDISRTESTAATTGTIGEGFRPVLTTAGAQSPVFRFFADPEANRSFVQEQLQLLFWFSRGVTVKPGVGEALAEHPMETGPDGRKAPILVIGRYGAGRTLYSAIDDSWRWRFYTGESIFDTYWVQQLRYLARGKKLGQRRITFTADRPVYELGDQVRATLRVLDAQVGASLPDSLDVELIGPDGQLVAREKLRRQEGAADVFTTSFTAAGTGSFTLRTPAPAPGLSDLRLPLEVTVPKLELAEPQVDRVGLARLASQTQGRPLELAEAAAGLRQIESARRVIPVLSASPLWDAPLALAIFALLITSEWVARKLWGMV